MSLVDSYFEDFHITKSEGRLVREKAISALCEKYPNDKQLVLRVEEYLYEKFFYTKYSKYVECIRTLYKYLYEYSKCLWGTIEEIAAMKPADFYNSKQLIFEKEQQTSVFGEVKSEVACGKCGSHNVKWEAKQIRRGDEGETIFYECRNPKCEHKWKI